MRAVRAAVLLSATACSAAPSCDDRLIETWNRFVTHANAYVSVLHVAGKADAKRAKQREQLRADWEELNACECW